MGPLGIFGMAGGRFAAFAPAAGLC